MKFRFHRGGLEDSMATVVEIESTKKAITTHCNNTMGATFYIPQDIEVKPYGYDDRIGWDTHVVTNPMGVLGFTDGPVNT